MYREMIIKQEFKNHLKLFILCSSHATWVFSQGFVSNSWFKSANGDWLSLAQKPQTVKEMPLMFFQSTHCEKSRCLVEKRCCQRLLAKCCVRFNRPQSEVLLGFFFKMAIAVHSVLMKPIRAESVPGDVAPWYRQPASHSHNRDVWGWTQPYNSISMPCFFF